LKSIEPPQSLISIPRKRDKLVDEHLEKVFAYKKDRSANFPDEDLGEYYDDCIHAHSVVLVKNKKMLAVGEQGQGILFDLKFMHSDSKGGERDIEGKDISSKHTNITPVTVKMVPLYEFDVNPPVTYNKKNGTRITKGSKGVFNIELIPDGN
jgi:hypothetical protein